jgi:hypothetical protein
LQETARLNWQSREKFNFVTSSLYRSHLLTFVDEICAMAVLAIFLKRPKYLRDAKYDSALSHGQQRKGFFHHKSPG